jgi:hypothetical protein
VEERVRRRPEEPGGIVSSNQQNRSETRDLTHSNEGMVLFYLVDTSGPLLGMDDVERVLFWFGKRLILDHATVSKRITPC